MKSYPCSTVDVFTDEPLRGNPVAVVHEAEGLSEARMQACARWTNLSETTFLLLPTDPAADYRVRIFTPGGELPFAGHPTLGTAHAWLQAGGQPRSGGEVIQECGVGLVRIRRDGARLAFRAPPCRETVVEAALLMAVLAALGVPAEGLEAAVWLDNGPQWLSLHLRDVERLRALAPDHGQLKALGVKVGVVAASPAGPGPAFEVRAFAAAIGVEEDPVTGSLNAGLAQWLMGRGRAPDRYVAAQGAALGRAGRVHVARDAEGLWIGGDVVSCVRGELNL